MKKFKKYLFLAVVSLVLASCSDDDGDDYSINDKNTVTVAFKNTDGNGGDITVGTTVLTSSSDQKHKFTTLKYIVSNIVLVKTDGAEVRYHFDDPDQGAFVIDQSGAVEFSVSLDEIQAGDYKQIQFGLGISPNAYTLGQEGQAAFWDACVETGMSWQWASGYKFARFDGHYAAPGADIPAEEPNMFLFHSGNIADYRETETPNVYEIATIDLPTTMRVRKDVSPTIHLSADMSKWLSGTNTLELVPTADDGKTARMMNPSLEIVQKGCVNMAQAFTATSVDN